MELKATMFITKDLKNVALILNGNGLLYAQTETENYVLYGVIRVAHEFRRSCFFFFDRGIDF